MMQHKSRPFKNIVIGAFLICLVLYVNTQPQARSVENKTVLLEGNFDSTYCQENSVNYFSLPKQTMPTRREIVLPKRYSSFKKIRRFGVVAPITTLYNAHTKEVLPIFTSPQTPPNLIKHFFRCRGFAKTIDMAPELIEAILESSKQFKAKKVTIISGFRSPKFNDTLAKKGRRVASESKHMKGHAIDFRLDTANASELGKWLKENFEGGVGIYKNDDFVHIDTGLTRSWRGR